MAWTKEDIKQDMVDSLDQCPFCHSEDCVPPAGDPYSDVLLIGEFPGNEEIAHGKPFVGPTGRLLKEELKRVGLGLYNFRLCNLWLHPPKKTTRAKKGETVDETPKKCLEYSVSLVLKEAAGKRLVVLIGSDTVKFFTGKSVSEWNGLLVKSALLSNPKIMAMVQPASAFNSSIGEVRFAVNRLKSHLEEK